MATTDAARGVDAASRAAHRLAVIAAVETQDAISGFAGVFIDLDVAAYAAVGRSIRGSSAGSE